MRVFNKLLLIVVLALVLAVSGGAARAAPQAGLTLAVSNPVCVQAAVNTGSCTITLRYVNAASTDPTFSHIEITVDGKVRVYATNFFETAINLNSAMLGKGLQVACGGPNASGNPSYGRQYQVGISAYLGSTAAAVDSATVNCPFYLGKTYLPMVKK